MDKRIKAIQVALKKAEISLQQAEHAYALAEKSYLEFCQQQQSVNSIKQNVEDEINRALEPGASLNSMALQSLRIYLYEVDRRLETISFEVDISEREMKSRKSVVQKIHLRMKGLERKLEDTIKRREYELEKKSSKEIEELFLMRGAHTKARLTV